MSRTRAVRARTGSRRPCPAAAGSRVRPAPRSSRRVRSAAGRPASGQQRFPHHRAGEARRSLGRIDVERRQQQRLHQPLVQACPGSGWCRQRACPFLPRSTAPGRDNRAGRCRALGALHRISIAAAGLSPRSSCQRCPVVRSTNGNCARLRPDQPRLGADRPRIGKRVTIARQQQVIAVVDGQVGRGVEIGTATAASLLGGLVDMHLETGIRPAGPPPTGPKFRHR